MAVSTTHSVLVGKRLLKIAILGWGSLVWSPRTLKLRDKFQRGGPNLSLEFSRISGNGRLTLVIDEQHGQSCETYFATSAFENLDDARENLREREEMLSIRAVGFADLDGNSTSEKAKERHPAATTAIREWGARNGFDAVIWTALASNFSEKSSVDFSVYNALS